MERASRHDGKPARVKAVSVFLLPCAQTQNYDAMQLEMASPCLRSSGESAKVERESVFGFLESNATKTKRRDFVIVPWP